MKALKRILVVDDEKTILLSLSYALKAEGVDVITCNKAEWAEKALQNYFFDLVITDVRLSKTGPESGLDILALTKKMHLATKVIVMTAFGSDNIRQEAEKLGADLYFDKPIDLEMLLSAVEKFGIPVSRKSAPPKPAT